MLLKVVVQVIPTFAVSCFKLPMGLCNDIKAMIRKFWWGQRGDRRKIHWKKWDILCQPTKGGLGFGELSKFNAAMLAKQVWRLVHDMDSLFYRVFNAKYFPTGSIFGAKARSGSYAWKNILKARKVILLGRGGARNFYLRGPSCSTNIFIKTTSHIHIYTCFFIIYTFFYLISYRYIYTPKKKKKENLVFSIKIMFDGNFS